MADQRVETDPASGWKLSIGAQMQRSDYYFETVLGGQSKWYSKKADQQKSRYLGFAITVIVLGSLISLLQIFSDQAWVSGVTAAMGAAVAILRAWIPCCAPTKPGRRIVKRQNA